MEVTFPEDIAEQIKRDTGVNVIVDGDKIKLDPNEQDATTEIKSQQEVIKLEQERDAEITKASKPTIKESDYRVTRNDILGAKVTPTKESTAAYKEDYTALKKLKALIDCL